MRKAISMGPEAERDTPAQVLIVDDDTEWGWRLEERLSSEFEVHVIEDGQEAFSKMPGVKAVVMEIELPGMDGAELAVSALSSCESPTLIVVVTGLEPEDLRLQLLENLPHVAAIIHKPVEPAVVHAAVACALAGDLKGARAQAMASRAVS